MKIKHLLPLLVIISSPIYLGIGSCGGGTNLADEVAKEIGICFGRVIDRSTRSGIADATVEIYAGSVQTEKDNTTKKQKETNFVAKTTTGTDDADTTLFNEAGMFRFENLPTDTGGTGFRVRVGATNYATLEATCVFSGASQDNTPLAEDMGDLALARGISLSVNLMNNGIAVATCPIYAFPTAATSTVDDGGGTGTFSVLGGVEISGTTDANGAVTLSGLNPLLDYTIVAPACDNNSDNVYDFSTAVAAYDSAIDSSTTIQIEANPVGRNEALALVDLNATVITDTAVAGFPVTDLVTDVFSEGTATTVLGGINDLLGISTSQNIVLVFNFPVSIASSPGIGLDFTNNLIALAGVTGFPLPGSVDATCTLSAGDTVLTCDPAADLTTNEIYTFSGTVAANEPFGTNGTTANEILNLSDLDDDGTLDGGFYVYNSGSGGISSTSSFTADNYDGVTNATGTVDGVYLEFPEFVYGTWEVISVVRAGTSVSLVGAGCRGTLHTTSAFLFEGNDPDTAGVITGTASDGTEAAGQGSAVVYRVPLIAAAACDTADVAGDGGTDVDMNNNFTGTANTVTLFIDATDVEGNRRQGEFTLAIQ
ncbi:MAG: hypothetical protein HYT76_05465 [Deltaproteobacteria bacterium]|nr:hypothetical protein [Deltaproteobacteria bacterium]